MLLCRRRFVKLTADVERLCSYVAIGCQASFATRQAASQTCQWAAPPWNPCIGCKIPVRVPLIPLIVGATNPFSIIHGKDSASKGTADAEEK